MAFLIIETITVLAQKGCVMIYDTTDKNKYKFFFLILILQINMAFIPIFFNIVVSVRWVIF